MKISKYLRIGCVLAMGCLSSLATAGEKEAEPTYSADVLQYLDRIYAPELRDYACKATNAEEHAQWRSKARPQLRALLGLDRMQRELGDWSPTVELGEPELVDGYTRTKGVMYTEPHVSVPFYLLRPLGEGPFKLAIMPHGHGPLGSYANLYTSEKERIRIATEDRDVGVQAVKRGYVAILPATRGLGCDGVPDINGRHGDRHCRSQLIHSLLAGRTPLGERVWDMTHFFDWGLSLAGVKASETLMLGNSGGGVVTIFSAACDERIAVAVPSSCFGPFLRRTGAVQRCDCNLIPGMLRFGGAHDVAGLIAPRRLLAVNGAKDKNFYIDDVKTVAARTSAIFEAAGVAENFELRIGPYGHRFYKELMWSFIEAVERDER